VSNEFNALEELLTELISQIDEANHPSLPKLWKQQMEIKLMDAMAEIRAAQSGGPK